MDVQKAAEIAKMEIAVETIQKLLSSAQFDVVAARKTIKDINGDHPENYLLYNLLFRGTPVPQSGTVCVDEAPVKGLIEDLQWKNYYLSAKLAGKTAEEIKKEIRQQGAKGF